MYPQQQREAQPSPAGAHHHHHLHNWNRVPFYDITKDVIHYLLFRNPLLCAATTTIITVLLCMLPLLTCVTCSTFHIIIEQKEEYHPFKNKNKNAQSKSQPTTVTNKTTAAEVDLIPHGSSIIRSAVQC